MTNSIPRTMRRACAVTDVPLKEMRCFDIDGVRILIANTDVGLFASDEMCSHEDASLCQGSLKGKLLRCPLHGSRFDLATGEVLDEPAEEGIRVYACEIHESDIYVEL